MALDASLFTLHFVRRRQEPSAVDVFAITTPTAVSSRPPIPPKDNGGSSSSKPAPFYGTIPDVAAQRARAIDNMDYTSHTPQYTLIRATNACHYSTIMLDGLLPECLLASITELNTSCRKRNIHLYNPDSTVNFEKRSMTLMPTYRFAYADDEFAWKRDGSRGKHSSFTCEVIRKPDPSVLAAQYRSPVSKGRPGILQMMDYNLDRLEIEDRKGLEVVLVMSLNALLDQEYDERLAASAQPNLYLCTSGLPTDPGLHSNSNAWSQAEERYRHSQLSRPGSFTDLRRSSPDLAPELVPDLEPNELLVQKSGTIEEYTKHALRLLRSDGEGQAMYLIVLKSDSHETSHKAVQVAAAIKAAYFRLPDGAKGNITGRSESVEEELYQYVQTPEDETVSASAANSTQTHSKKRVIKLDGPSPPSTPSPPVAKAKAYTPPSKLRIILSKERIVVLEPKRPIQESRLAQSSIPMSSESVSTNDRPDIPARPASPSAQTPSPARPSKGKAFLNKLGIH